MNIKAYFQENIRNTVSIGHLLSVKITDDNTNNKTLFKGFDKYD